MEGRVKRLDRKKQYGFIEGDRADYFFHRDDFDGHWDDLCDDYDNKRTINVTFDPTRTSKGLRAENVGRVDGGV